MRFLASIFLVAFYVLVVSNCFAEKSQASYRGHLGCAKETVHDDSNIFSQDGMQDSVSLFIQPKTSTGADLTSIHLALESSNNNLKAVHSTHIATSAIFTTFFIRPFNCRSIPIYIKKQTFLI